MQDDDDDSVMIKPPAHVTANHVYSNTYRTTLAKGYDLEEAQRRARKARSEFSSTGRIREGWCGTFRGPNKASIGKP